VEVATPYGPKHGTGKRRRADCAHPELAARVEEAAARGRSILPCRPASGMPPDTRIGL